MRIAVYIEGLKTFTSGMPHRGMLLALVQKRCRDQFILVYRKGILSPDFSEYLEVISAFSNVVLFVDSRSTFVSNVLALLHFKNHCKISIKADLYLNVDAEYLGDNCQKQIVTVHDLSSVHSEKLSSLSGLNRLARKFGIVNGVIHSDHIVAISQFTAADIESTFNEKRKISVIYNGISDTWFSEANCTFPPIALPTSYFVWWGAFTGRKNIERLIAAYKLLESDFTGRNDYPRMVLIGAASAYRSVIERQIAADQFLTSNVFVLDRMRFVELKWAVANSMALIFPSLYEGFGLPIIEAYSQGLMAVTASSGSLPEVAGLNGFVVDPNSIEDISRGMRDACRVSEGERLRIGAANKIYATGFNYNIAASRYSELIDKICVVDHA